MTCRDITANSLREEAPRLLLKKYSRSSLLIPHMQNMYPGLKIRIPLLYPTTGRSFSLTAHLPISSAKRKSVIIYPKRYSFSILPLRMSW
jgi:hypothetical protein